MAVRAMVRLGKLLEVAMARPAGMAHQAGSKAMVNRLLVKVIHRSSREATIGLLRVVLRVVLKAVMVVHHRGTSRR